MLILISVITSNIVYLFKFQFAALAASGADIDIPAFLEELDDDEDLEDIDLSPWLSERELAATADYEMTRLKNMKLNYEMLLKLGEFCKSTELVGYFSPLNLLIV